MRSADSQSTESGQYILGTDSAELDRLRFQHHVWLPAQLALMERAGVGRGATVLDLGCGPGFTSIELAHVVGPGGRVIARDLSARFLSTLARECEHLGLSQVETSEGPVEELTLPDASADFAYARWLLCWLDDLTPALESVARVLRPGGRLLVQDYLDWGTLGAFPHDESFEPVRRACLASWKANGVEIDVVRRLPTCAARAGLEIESLHPHARAGKPGSPVWGWIDDFLRFYLPRCVEAGLMTREQLEAWRRDWELCVAEDKGWVVAPMVADVVLRKV